MVYGARYNPMARLTATKALLNLLSVLGDTGAEFAELWTAVVTGYGPAYQRGGAAYVAELKRFRSQADLRRKVKELARRRYVEIQKVGERFVVLLTSKGYGATFAQRCKNAPQHKMGWYTVVIFDIPEEFRTARCQLRRLLRQSGFIKIQQSVWASQADTYEIVVEFVKLAKIARWVNVYRATDFFKLPK